MEKKVKGIRFNLEITASKVLAYVMVVASLFVFKEPQNVMAAWYLAGGLIGVKTVLGEVNRIKK